jgi:RimJ/RimL family protein N-acetyltransferase
MTSETLITDVVVRRELRSGDPERIVELHDRVYRAEYGLDGRFAPSVARSLQAALVRGWPSSGGAVWVADRGGELCGSLGLTDEGSALGRVRWFVFAPELRGRGLGRSLVAELLAQARAAGLQRLELETFSDLTAAARLYLEAGFRLESQRETDQWGPPIIYQRYALELR